MNRERLIQRYEHNYSGWVVTTKRRGRRFRRYFSDQPKGRRNALRAARAFRDNLVAQLPRPTKIKRTDVRNTTGVSALERNTTGNNNTVSGYAALDSSTSNDLVRTIVIAS